MGDPVGDLVGERVGNPASDLVGNLGGKLMSPADDTDSLVNLPKTERGERTIARIIESAEQLFYAKGYHETSIKDITSKAGVGLGTFYLYFKDKKSLYVHLLTTYNHQIRKEISIKIHEKGEVTRREAERIGILTFLEIVRAKPHYYNIIWESLYIDKQLFIDYYSTFGKYYNRQLREAQAKGEIKPWNPEIMAFMLMGISNFVGLRYALFDSMSDLDRVADEVIRILDQGIFMDPKEPENSADSEVSGTSEVSGASEEPEA